METLTSTPILDDSKSRAASTLFQRAEAERDDFFEIEVAGNRAVVFRPLKDGKRREKYYVKRGNFFRCTGYATKGDAGNAARRLLKAHLDKRLDVLDATKLRHEKPVATVGEIIAAYEASVRTFTPTMRPSTVRSNVRGLRNVLLRVHWPSLGNGAKASKEERQSMARKVDALPGTALTEEVVEKFEAAHLKAAKGNPVLLEQRIRGARSTVNQARSLFATSALRCYRRLTMPDLMPFMKARMTAEPKRMLKHFEQADMAEMAKAARELREEQPMVYLTHLCFRHLAMRNIEILNCKLGWIARRCDTARVMTANATTGEVELLVRPIAGFMEIIPRADYDPKGTAGVVPIDAAVLAEIDALTKGRKAEDYLIAAASKTERQKIVDRLHGDFVRPWFEDFDKNGYELRRWAGTKILELTGNEGMQKRFLRHAPDRDSRVTRNSYTTKLPPPPPITFEDVGLHTHHPNEI